MLSRQELHSDFRLQQHSSSPCLSRSGLGGGEQTGLLQMGVGCRDKYTEGFFLRMGGIPGSTCCTTLSLLPFRILLKSPTPAMSLFRDELQCKLILSLLVRMYNLLFFPQRHNDWNQMFSFAEKLRAAYRQLKIRLNAATTS